MSNYRDGYTCQYCGKETVEKEMRYGPVQACESCNAYVSISDDNTPRGCVANNELRLLRRTVHIHIDLLIKHKMKKDNVTKQDAKKALYDYATKILEMDFDIESLAQLNHNESIALDEVLKNILWKINQQSLKK